MWLDRGGLFKAAAGDLPKRVAQEMRPSGCVAGACGMHGWMRQIPYILFGGLKRGERVKVHLKARARRLRTFRRCAKHPAGGQVHLRAGRCQ